MAHKPENLPSFYRAQKLMSEQAKLDYDQACRAWAESLPDTILASMEVDYSKGLRDESTIDAHREFMRRFPSVTHQAKLLGYNTEMRCPAHPRGRLPKTCEDCAALASELIRKHEDQLVAAG